MTLRLELKLRPNMLGKVLMLLLGGATVSFSQQISASAIQQMRDLMLEKASRTAVQKKLSSDLIYASRQVLGLPITPSLQSLDGLLSDLAIDGRGAVLVNISATVSPALLNDIAGLGGQVIQSYPAYNSIHARVPLSALEQVAALFGVSSIEPSRRPFTNRTMVKPTSASRAAAIRQQLAMALGQSGRSRVAPPELFSLRRLTRLIGLGFAGPDTSGDIAHKANLVRSMLNIDGTGVKIGVISDGVTTLATEQAAGRLPPVVTVLSGQGGTGPGPCPDSGSTNNCPNEGTAMLEIVYSLAPGAQLYFATANPTPAQFATNILALRTAGCDIIVDDVGYFNEGAFQDGPIAQAVTTVVNAGAFYFSSAANSGGLNKGSSGTWEGDFVNSGTSIPAVATIEPGLIHSFSGSNSDQLTAASGPISLKWSDPLGQSCNDYDIFVLNSTLTGVTAVSNGVQDFCTSGTARDPYEIVGSQNNGNRVVVVLYSGVTRAIRVDTNRGRLAIATSGSTYGHAAATEAFGVAAVDVHTASGGAFTGGATNPVEVFSSDGLRRVFFNANGTAIAPNNFLFGTNGGLVRNKPDISAADGVPTGVPGFTMFYGTSAAAPHAAAIAALVKQAKPSINQAQMFTALTTTALNIEGPGYDRDSGYGIVMALPAVQSVIPAGATITITSSPGTGLSFTVSGTGCAPGSYTTPAPLVWTPSSSCIVTFASPQTITGVRYTFGSWTDGPTTNPRTITAPSATTTFTANFTTTYQLTMSSSAGGVVTPASGTFYNPGTVVAITATANPGFTFAGWTGTGTGSYTGANASTNITMNGAITEFATFTSVGGTSGLQFVPITPCRVMDTRPPYGFTGAFGPPALTAFAPRDVPILSGRCNIPATARAYSFNITVVPLEPSLGYLSIYPSGQPTPLVSTLNVPDGLITSNAAIVPAGTNGSIAVLVTNATDVIIDINGYFAPATTGSLAFYPVAPCRVVDTRLPAGTFGAPFLAGNSSRNFPIPQSACGIPGSAMAYSLNVTVVPRTGFLGYLTVWPTGQSMPLVSTLNSTDGTIKANAAIVPAGTNGGVSFFVTNDTELVLDINGYFAPPGTGGMNFYPVTPCRIADTRNATGPFGGPVMGAGATRTFPVPQSGCGLPGTAQAYSLNMTVVPAGFLGYLTVFPAGQAQPLVSTLNALKGIVLANAALVPAGTSGAISVYVQHQTHVVIDTNGYFAP